MGLTWQTTPEQAFSDLGAAYADDVHRAVFALATRYAPEIESWMKTNAKWTDRTGNARQTLWAEAFDFVDIIVLAFGHGVDYGTFLEWAHGGRFAIIAPALDYFIPKVWNDVQRLLS